MLSILELDTYFQALKTVEDLQTRIESSTIKAVRYDRAAGSVTYTTDTVGKFITKAESRADMLARIRKYIKRTRPAVEQTITAAVAGMRGSQAIKIEMTLKMHYLSGRDWEEIADLFKTDAAQLKDKALQRLQRIKGGETDHSGYTDTEI